MTSLTSSDLTVCDLEPIRVPGAIQPVGRLLVLHPETLDVLAYSENWPADQLDSAMAPLSAALRDDLALTDTPRRLPALCLREGQFEVTGHRTADHLIVELEGKPSGENRAEAPIYSLARWVLPSFQHAGTVVQAAEVAAVAMKRLTRFGRCLVYRFDDDGNGEVLAEQLDPGYDSYAGHRFPAADIPKQARDLYRINRFRLISDANYRPVGLIVRGPSLTAADIDLSLCQFRSVSAVHLEYMRNMGTLASMSVSIVIEGKLWGLFSCHHHEPMGLDSATRLACSHLGELLALQIQAKETNTQMHERLELRKKTLEIIAALADSDATLERLVHPDIRLSELASANGVAVVLNERVWTSGVTPTDPQILALAQWVIQMRVDVFETNQLRAALAGTSVSMPEDVLDSVAGLLAVSISQVHRHVIFWFRPEIAQTVTWAGDPSKATIEVDGRIHPRLSFASWREVIRGFSQRWRPAEVGAVRDLRQALIGIVLRRAEELAAVADELGRANKELEAFSYTVSHDLRAPMRHIAGYVDLVLNQEGKKLSDNSHRYLAHAKEAAAFAGQLVDALLDFSRMGRASLQRRWNDPGLLLEGLRSEFARLDPQLNIEWQIDPAFAEIYADPVLLQIAVRNLLSNAVKYSRMRSPQQIRVRGIEERGATGLQVTDNGVGFQMKYVDKLFGVFQRLHSAEEFEGTGIGLANVKRIVERHGGRVWAHGAPGDGATFGFILPQAAGAPDNNDEDASRESDA